MIELRTILKNAGYKLSIRCSDIIISMEDSMEDSVVFEIDYNDDDDIKRLILQECDHHIKMIDSEDPDYFDECDAKYLKTTWRNIVVSIKDLLEKADLPDVTIAEDINEDFINQFRSRFPSVSSVIDFSRRGTGLTREATSDGFIRYNLRFFKDKEVSHELFEEKLDIFRSTCSLDTDQEKFYIECLDKTFEIGDVDDTLAVLFSTEDGKYCANIWFRWFGDVKKVEND